ncbi:MAG: hypothetical protein E6705_01580 [Peptoniphilus harei]|uniref:hypothetical protein n=1 Tax=Peptoniphilus harei TaxID=54005 RepID=UPI002590474B|nr:hypothetical protein [Peptoniphilus harei]MDU3086582.1 hypothetical protein [Peptoniphilus harei]MDU6744222.1 hypothetical protein [Peptoniphilus harei]
MSIIDDFFKEIEKALFAEASNNDWDLFNDLEDYFIDNNEMIFKESERVSDLGYEMQDVIAEMSYIDNFTECRIKINKIYNEMKKELQA